MMVGDGGVRKTLVILALLVGLAVVPLAWPGTAKAAAWCGSTATENRDPGVTGRTIRVIYAIGSDGEDRSADWASRISAEMDGIASWWRTQDPDREPRFDVFPFPCGLQIDLTVQRLPGTVAELRPVDSRAERIYNEVAVAGGLSVFQKYIVYYDAPVDETNLCGQGGGDPFGSAIAIVYLQTCSGVPTQTTAAHELLHSLGALAPGAPSACPDSLGHPCDSESDILFPYAGLVPLTALALDVGRNDYYGHSGGWLDVQDSRWLRLVNQQARLSLTIRGAGEVESDVPGVLCTASCETDWDTGSPIDLSALPADGQRFIRWEGGCTGVQDCSVVMEAAKAVSAVFAPASFKLSLTIKGSGRILGAGAACSSRCVSQRPSFMTVALRASPAKGWKFSRWTGACRGSAPTCRLPMAKNTDARALFIRRK